MAKAPVSIIGSFRGAFDATIDAAKGVPKLFDGTGAISGFIKRSVTAIPDTYSGIMRNSKIGPLVVLGAGLAAVAGIAGAWRGHQEKRAHDQMEATQEALQQQMMVQAQSYKNSVSPYEAALLDERMRAGGNGASMSQMESDRRAAAAGQVAPTGSV